jgi:hypothetical protein
MLTKNKQTSSSLLKLTTLYGYALFAALTLSQFLSVIIPFSRRPDWVGNDRVITLYVGIVSAMLLPPLCSFFIGYAVTAKSKIPYLREFSGVALGLSGLWLSHVLGIVAFRVAIPQPEFLPLQVYQFGYAIIAILVVLLIGLVYKRTGSSSPLYLDKPLVVVLLASLAGWFVFNLTGGASGYVRASSSDILNTTLTGLSIIAIPLLYFLCFRYAPSENGKVFNKIAFAAVFTGFYVLTVEAIESLLFSADAIAGSYRHQVFFGVVAYPLAFLILAMYMRAIPTGKKSRSKVAKKNVNKKLSHPIYTTVVIAVISLPVIIAVIIASVYPTGFIRTMYLKHTLATDTANSRAAHEWAGDVTHQKKIKLLQSLGVIDSTQKSYSEKVDTCELEGISGGGWVYSNWQQKCYFTYIDLLPVAMTREEAAAKLTASLDVLQVFGSPRVKRYASDQLAVCDYFEKDYRSSLRYFDFSQPEYANGKGCKVNVADMGTPGSVTTDYHGTHRVVRTFSDAEVDRSKAYIEVTTDRSVYYLSDKLGCKPIMCGSPIEAPVPAFN